MQPAACFVMPRMRCPVSYLIQPCPLCGESTAVRLDDAPGPGWFMCVSCDTEFEPGAAEAE